MDGEQGHVVGRVRGRRVEDAPAQGVGAVAGIVGGDGPFELVEAVVEVELWSFDEAVGVEESV